MALLLQDADDMEALDAALSFVDACLPSPTASVSAASSDSVQHSPNSGSEDDERRLGDELDELLRGSVLSFSDSSSTAAATATQLQSPTPQLVLPTPLVPLAANITAPDAVALKENGRLRGGCRSSSCQRVCSAEVAKGKTKRRVKVNPNRARNERKNELAYLRNKVKQMESDLGELHRRHQMDSGTLTTRALSYGLTAPAPIGADARHDTGIPPFWRDMATRQKLRREKSERENARLKLVLEGQIKLARSMEMLLQKRARQQLSECESCVGGESNAQGRTLDFLKDKCTFEALLASVDAAYREVDEVFAANGLCDSETPSRDARMREGANGMYLDISSNKLLPFGKQDVGDAVWNHFKGGEKHRGNLYEKAAQKLGTEAETVMEDFKMEFMGKTTRADFRVKQVLRRYVDADHDREVVVWVTSVHSLDEGKLRPFAGLGFAEKGYAVIKRPTSPSLVRGGYTMLQMCSLVVPQKAERCVQDATVVGAFTEFVLNVIVANATVSQERIENVLLDRAVLDSSSTGR